MYKSVLLFSPFSQENQVMIHRFQNFSTYDTMTAPDTHTLQAYYYRYIENTPYILRVN